eukprot:CAMPEP_0174818478 /NCGR_PEP_ID=MMETSP1107-20130205/1146_1 /TAXON_ID=36770 /ORGANISM="Paraphysomonas vestita, Strain GFlagA" /LENGTH=695 /DNA_ID=CAMNT_0016030341 /DNA_START=885 /DNA_END=2972 /DNA_ORIENTATION=-
MKDREAATKWRLAMSKSSTAVVDINELSDIAKQVLEEEDLDITSLQISKSITTFRKSRSELAEQASKLLKKLINSKESGSDNLEKLIDELQIGSGILVYPIVDGSGSTQNKLIAQLISAYLIARAQKLSFFIFDGTQINIIQEETTTITEEENTKKSKWTPEELEEIKYAKKFLQNIKVISNNILPFRNLPDLERINTSITILLDSIPYDSTINPNSIRLTDVLFLTTSNLDQVRDDLEQYQNILQRLQNRPNNQTTLRTLSIHRLIQTFDVSAGTIPLNMRSTGIITNKSNVTLDLLLVMDLTGSMGAWMEQAKTHLTNIVNSLKDETGIGEIRIGFIGYRDYNDNGRTVHHTFLPITSSDPVMTLLRQQSPSGGGDAPEDVLSGFTLARTNFDWRANLRLVLLVADAPAHGYMEGGGDYHPTGRCPDQQPPHLNLEETTRSLAFEHNVDLLFCRLGAATKKMENMFASVYNNGGFGVLPITSGPDAFRAAILSTISSSILKVLTPENVSGLQTFSGGTTSSLIATLNSSLRESFNFISKSFEELKENTEMNVVDESIEENVEVVDDVVGEAGIELTIEGEDDEEEDDDDDEKDEEEEVESKKEKVLKRILPSTTDTKFTARTDYERILHELNLEELNPVRLALDMPVERSLLDKATGVLLAAGITIQDLVDQHYPDEIVEVMRLTGVKKLERI